MRHNFYQILFLIAALIFVFNQTATAQGAESLSMTISRTLLPRSASVFVPSSAVREHLSKNGAAIFR